MAAEDGDSCFLDSPTQILNPLLITISFCIESYRMMNCVAKSSNEEYHILHKGYGKLPRKLCLKLKLSSKISIFLKIYIGVNIFLVLLAVARGMWFRETLGFTQCIRLDRDS